MTKRQIVRSEAWTSTCARKSHERLDTRVRLRCCFSTLTVSSESTTSLASTSPPLFPRRPQFVLRLQPIGDVVAVCASTGKVQVVGAARDVALIDRP